MSLESIPLANPYRATTMGQFTRGAAAATGMAAWMGSTFLYYVYLPLPLATAAWGASWVLSPLVIYKLHAPAMYFPPYRLSIELPEIVSDHLNKRIPLRTHMAMPKLMRYANSLVPP